MKCKQQHYMCKLSVSERAFCYWVGSRSGRIHTLNEPYQCSFRSGLRPPLQLGLVVVALSAPECDCCIHTWQKDPHQRGNEPNERDNSIEPNEYTLTQLVAFLWSKSNALLLKVTFPNTTYNTVSDTGKLLGWVLSRYATFSCHSIASI